MMKQKNEMVKNAQGIILDLKEITQELKDVTDSLIKGEKYDKERVDEIIKQVKEYQSLASEKSRVLLDMLKTFYTRRQLYFIASNNGCWNFILNNKDKKITIAEIIMSATEYKKQTAEEIRKELKENLNNYVEYCKQFEDLKIIKERIEKEIERLQNMAMLFIIDRENSRRENEEMLGF